MCAPAQSDGVLQGARIRCVLVHDHVLMRQGLRRLLEDESDIEVIAETGDVAEALRVTYEKRPEVVLVDAEVFGCACEQAEQLLLRQSPQSKVLFVATNRAADAPLRSRARVAVRETPAEELVAMVRAMRTGVWAYAERRKWPVEEAAPRKRVLTVREREVLKLLAEGRTVRSAADVLGLSAKTVDAHKFNLMRKLGIHNKAELVMWAIQKRVVKLPMEL